MVSAESFRELCLSLEDTREAPHFERLAFRTPRRIFATLAADGATANLCLTPDQQAAVAAADPAFAPLEGAWGRRGWTVVDLRAVRPATLRDAVAWAHAGASPGAAAEPREPTKRGRGRRS